MSESPIFARTHDFLVWLLPCAAKFPRPYRFTLTERVQRQAFEFQENLLEAGLHTAGRAETLRRANTKLAHLRYTLRLCKDLEAIKLNQYEHAARLLDEIGRLLGGWLKKTTA